MNETQERIEIEIEAIIPEGWEHLVTRSRGQAWVELAAPVDSECCPTQARPGPCWDWVDDGMIRGGMGGQCDGCGSRGTCWVHSGARLIGPDDDTETVLVHMTVNLQAVADAVVAAKLAAFRRRLAEDLTTWIALDEDERECSGLGGSEMSPGIYDARSYTSTEPEWVAWDDRPVLDGRWEAWETIEVTVSEAVALLGPLGAR